MNKRLFVSVNYDRLHDTRFRNAINGHKYLNTHDICHWDSSAKSIKEGTNDNATIFFIMDDYTNNLPIDINKEEDFLLAHLGKTDNSIKNQFDKKHVKEGHHGPKTHAVKEYRYYAIVLETLLNGKDEAGRKIETGQEAEAIINTIWPDLKARKELESIVKIRIKDHPNYDENSIIQHSQHINTYVCEQYPETTKNTQP